MRAMFMGMDWLVLAGFWTATVVVALWLLGRLFPATGRHPHERMPDGRDGNQDAD